MEAGLVEVGELPCSLRTATGTWQPVQQGEGGGQQVGGLVLVLRGWVVGQVAAAAMEECLEVGHWWVEVWQCSEW